MRANLQPVPSSQPRLFQYSLDWRFLLPIDDPARVRVAFDGEADFSETLERIGIPVSNQLPASNFKGDERDDTHAFVLPFGLPVRWVSAKSEEQIEFYRSIRHRICPGGYFLLGFGNSWSPRPRIQPGYRRSTPRRAAYQVDQAGFKSTKIFGAMPNLRIPEYIFELNSQALHFALEHRFKRKPVLLNALRMLRRTTSLARVSSFLPCYFALAIA